MKTSELIRILQSLPQDSVVSIVSSNTDEYGTNSVKSYPQVFFKKDAENNSEVCLISAGTIQEFPETYPEQTVEGFKEVKIKPENTLFV